jgi:V-type H+-transporting ATPase subunit H
MLVESRLPFPVDPTDIFKWIVFQLSSSNSNVIDIALQYIQALLSITKYRYNFIEQEGAMAAVIHILAKEGGQAQIQYQAIYIIWLLSFEVEIAAKLEKVYHVVPLLREISKSAIKEKVIRIIISTFKVILFFLHRTW